MGRRLSRLIGALKDKASMGKALILPNLDVLPIRLAILEATTHYPWPPSHRHIATILSSGVSSSRVVASSGVAALLDRLHNTRSWAVALKCLIVVHRIAQHGSFILQDQLGFYPSAGGRNSLKLTNFRDPSSPENWALSSWVRWYARFLDSVLQASRTLGYFFNSAPPVVCVDFEDVVAMTNEGLLKEVEALVAVMEDICRPEFDDNRWNPVVAEARRLAVEDVGLLQKELLVRVREAEERIPAMNVSESANFAWTLSKLGGLLDGCFISAFRGEEDKGAGQLRDSVNHFLAIAGVSGGGRGKTRNHWLSESERFENSSLVSASQVQFSSGRVESFSL